MITAKGFQCDVCNVSFTPNEGVYYEFSFLMIASKTQPKLPATLVACPECPPKLKLAVDRKELLRLPPGRLRNALRNLLMSVPPRLAWQMFARLQTTGTPTTEIKG